MSAVENNIHAINTPRRSPPLESGGGDGQVPGDMSARLAKLEGELGGLKHGQSLLLGAIGLVAAIVALVVALSVFTLTRINLTNDRLEAVAQRQIELPTKVGAELRDIAKTLADSITAARQAPPQVILLPSQPAMPPTPPPAKQ
jgi:hypothetical protein